MVRKEVDRELKIKNIERTQRSVEYQKQLKLEKIMLEDEKMADIKRQNELFKAAKSTFKQQLVEDMEMLKSGDINLSALKTKYKENLEQETLAFSSFLDDSKSPTSRKSIYSESPSKRKQPISSLSLTIRSS
jgi:hypothetical protein